jgi:hypothetical protein
MESGLTLDINDVIEKLTTVIQFFNVQVQNQIPIRPTKVNETFNLQSLISNIRVQETSFEISVPRFNLYRDAIQLLNSNISEIEENDSRYDVSFIKEIREIILKSFDKLPMYTEFLAYATYREALYRMFITIGSTKFFASIAGLKPFLKNLNVQFDPFVTFDAYKNKILDIIEDKEIQTYYLPSDLKRNTSMLTMIRLMEEDENDFFTNFKYLIDAYYENAKPIQIKNIKSKQDITSRVAVNLLKKFTFHTLNDFLNVWNNYTTKLIDNIELGEKIETEKHEKMIEFVDLKTLDHLPDDTIDYSLVEKFIINYSILNVYNHAVPDKFITTLTTKVLELLVDKKYFWAVVLDIYFNLIMKETSLMFHNMNDANMKQVIDGNIKSLDKLAKQTPPHIWLTRNYTSHILLLKSTERWCREESDEEYENLCDEYEKLRDVVFTYYDIPKEKSIEAIFQQSLKDLKKYSDKISTYKKEFDSWIAQQREKLKSSVKISVKEPTPSKREQKDVVDVIDAIDVVDEIDMPKKIAEISEPLSTEQKEPLSTSELPERSKLILKRLPVVLLLISGGLVAAAVNYSWFVSLLNSEESETLQEIVIDDKNMTSKTNLSSIFTNFMKPSQKPSQKTSQEKSKEDKGSFKVKLQKTAPSAIPKPEEKRAQPQKMSLTSAIDQFIDTNINTKKDVEKYVPVSKEDKGSFKVKLQKTAPSAIPKPEEKRAQPQKMVPTAAIDQFIDTNINTKKDVEKYVPELIYEMFSRIPGLGLKEAVVCLFALSTLIGLKRLLPVLISKVTFIFAKSEVIQGPIQFRALKKHTTRKSHNRHARKKSKRHSKSTSRRKK